MSNENKKPLEEVRKVLSKGPAAAAQKLEEDVENLIANAPEEPMEKLAEKIEDIAARAGDENLETLGQMVDNTTGQGAVVADSSDANPIEPQEALENAAEKLAEKVDDIAARAGDENLETLGQMVDNTTGQGAVVADSSDANPIEPQEALENAAEKLAEKVDDIAARAGDENLKTLGQMVDNATGQGAVVAPEQE